MTAQIHFILNDRTVCTSQSPGSTVLDYLRSLERLTGTKEGCREGGCGACTVLLGELQGGNLVYKSVLSCLLPLGEISGKHLVTIEGLNQQKLSPVQQAIADFGATQCGFCTPGIVMSLTGYLLANETEVSDEGVKNALSGNLCRCTGYASLKRVGSFLVKLFGNRTKLTIADLIAQKIIPEYFQDVRSRLSQLAPTTLENGKATPDFVIAGGTDIYVEQDDVIPDSQVTLLNQTSVAEMKGISSYDNQIHIGALTTFAEFATHPEIIKLIPDIQTYVQRIASWQIRNRATLGGNIVAASPLADGSIMLLALESQLVLDYGVQNRILPMTDFFQGYKETAKKSGEILTEIVIPLPSALTKFNFEKISKRQYLDCAVVNSAIKIRCEGDVIREIAVSMGGVSAIPLLLKETSAYFLGKRITSKTIQGVLPFLQQEISTISDVHGSEEYKRLLARQVLIAHFTKLFPEFLQVRDVYATN
ncbi:molybdopterin dehydrogenase FAD-binding protein [Calothrix sp. NIES-2100]|uniref:FAD binding domain-containing protein n=1 Tax=Calothrix sp. NIES-2100 TaxID=1954172 RepID=UPI000B61960A|nr:molybdopterin dehydrogenase FAD-binding protein [Calothrix sp. NIES-2100]